MITRALCRLRRTDGLRVVEVEMYNRHGLAVGDGYNLDLDGDRTEWTIIKIMAERPLEED
jgi:hypothetical protein